MKSLCVIAAFLVLCLTDASAAIRPQEMPQVKKKVNPVYPEIFRRAGIEGEVMIKAMINEDGKVEKAEAVKASKPEFAEASITAIKQWEFTPATKDGKPVKAEVLVPLNFRLGDKRDKSPGALQMNLQNAVISLIKGVTADSLRDFIEKEAYAIVDGEYRYLTSLVFDNPKTDPLIERRNFEVEYSHMTGSVSEDAAVLVMKSSSDKSKRSRFDTVVLMKNAEGNWKIHSWHMSK